MPPGIGRAMMSASLMEDAKAMAMEREIGRRNNPWSLWVWGAAATLLATPLVAMRLTDEVNWTASDFGIFAVMLGAAGGAWELGMRTSSSMAYRLGVTAAVGTAFLLVWATLAVGFIGNEDHPANLMYAGLLIIGLVGAVLVRFRPGGLAATLAVMAAGQMAAGAVGAGLGQYEAIKPTVVFTLMWLSAATLFYKAARDQAR